MARITGHARFGDCPVHGDAVSHIWQGTLDDGTVAWLCRECAEVKRVRPDGQPSFVKVVVTNVRSIQLVNRNGYGAQPKACGGACTSGKRSCDCRCGGRCHGAGRCLGGHE
jgi:hypothetical protein